MDQLLSAYGRDHEVDDSLQPPLKKIKVNATPDVPDVMVCENTFYFIFFFFFL